MKAGFADERFLSSSNNIEHCCFFLTRMNLINLIPKTSALIVVDVQEAFNDPIWGSRNNPTAEENISTLLSVWRKSNRAVIHIHHRSPLLQSLFHPSRPGFNVKSEALPIPDELVLHKEVNSSFIGTNLEAHLRKRKHMTLVICGITTDHCVSTTARMAGNLGFDTYVVSDGTATFERYGPDGKFYTAEQMHDSALASLHKEFATIVDSKHISTMLRVESEEASPI